MSILIRNTLVPVILGCAVLAMPAPAQTPTAQELIERAKARQEIEVQRLEQEVKDALAEVQGLGAKEAAQTLRRLLGRIEENRDLSADRKSALVKRIKDRLEIAEAAVTRTDRKDADKNGRGAQTEVRREDQSRRDADEERVNRLLANVRDLQRQGRGGEAARLAAEIRARYPNSPAVQAAGVNTAANDRLNEARELRADKERRTAQAFLDVERSALPPLGDVEFPKDWAQKTKMRSTATALTAEEKAILRSLDTLISMDLRNVKLEEVLQLLEKEMGQNLLIDKAGLEQAMVTYDTPVSVRVKGVATRTVLRKILSEVGLAYVVKDNVIQVTSQDRARSLMTVRTYYLGDVVGLVDFRWGPYATQFQMYQNVVMLVEMIKQKVDPESWEGAGRGGFGSITFHPQSMSLVVKQSAEVHYALQGGLGLR